MNTLEIVISDDFRNQLKEEIKKELLEEIEIKQKRKYYSKKEIMKLYKISHDTLDKLEKQGLPVKKIDGKRYCINVEEFETYYYKQ